MAELIRFEDIFDENAFSRAKKELNDILALLDKLREGFSNIAVTSKNAIDSSITKDNAKATKELLDNTQKLVESTKAISSIDKEREKIKEKIKELEGQHAKELELLKTKYNELKKQVKEAAKEELNKQKIDDLLNKTNTITFQKYKELTQVLSLLKERYKDLAAAGQENTEAGQKILAQIKELDERVKKIDESVGEYYRNVGAYKEKIIEAFNEIASSGNININILSQLKKGLSDANNAAKLAGGGFRGLSAAVKVFSQSLKATGILLLLDTLVKLLDRIKIASQGSFINAQKELEAKREELQLRQRLYSLQLEFDSIDEDSLANLIKKRALLLEQLNIEQALAQKRLEQLQKQKAELEESTKERGVFYYIGSAIEFLTKSLLSAFKLITSALSELISFFSQGAGQKIKQFATTFDDLSKKAADFFTEFKNADATEKLKELQSTIENIAEAENELKQIQQRRQQIVGEYTKKYEEMIDKTLQLLSLEEERGSTALEQAEENYRKSIEELEKYYQQAKEVLSGNEDALYKLQQMYLEKKTSLESEYLEKRASILEDLNERLAKLNAKLLNDELEIQIISIREKYKALLEEAQRLSLELNQDLSDKIIQIEKMMNEEIERAIAEYNKKLLDKELERIRIREELLNSEYDLLIEKYNSQNKDITALQIERLNKENDLLQERIKVINDYYDKATDAEKMLLDKQKNIILAQIIKNNAEIKAIRTKQVLELIDATKEGLQATESIIQNIFEQQKSRIDSEISFLSKRLDIYKELASAGALDATESILEVEKEIEKRELEKQKMQRRLATLQLAANTLNVFTNLLNQNSPAGALAQTTAIISSLLAFISSLPKFHAGTKEVKVKNTIYDTLIARVEQGERIIPSHLNRKVQNMSNEELISKAINASSNVNINFDVDSFREALSVVISAKNNTKKYNFKL